jgi:hypothetical protein
VFLLFGDAGFFAMESLSEPKDSSPLSPSLIELGAESHFECSESVGGISVSCIYIFFVSANRPWDLLLA